MKTISANPQSIRDIFKSEYVIPDYQRPYSWDTYQCDQLWDDFILFYEGVLKDGEQYFLGNIVVFKEKDKFFVIDGQQRLTTLLLFIKILFDNASTLKALESCLKKQDSLTNEIKDELRIKSEVKVYKDHENMKAIILNQGAGQNNNNHKKNYEHLSKKFDEWKTEKQPTADKLNQFILTLLDSVVLLPILCESQDDALSIFQTINDRGMALDHADIFKAQLYSIAPDKKEFVNRWDSLKNHEWLFRIHMHILRAKGGDVGNEKALRIYFQEKGENRLEDYDTTMKSLGIYNCIIESWEQPTEISIWWNILETYPNQYWNYPLFVFLHKHGKYEEDEFSIDEARKEEFTNLIKETAKYCFIKGVADNNVNTIKDAVFKVCAAINEEASYLQEYKNNIENKLDECTRKLKKNDYGVRYRKGLVLLASFLNSNQDNKEYLKTLEEKHDIEHILPRQWCNYDQWTEELQKNNIDKLGNLILIEKKKNIQASNEFFQRKKTIYKNSKVQDVKDLTKIENWYPEDLEKRHKEVMQRLENFFKGD